MRSPVPVAIFFFCVCAAFAQNVTCNPQNCILNYDIGGPQQQMPMVSGAPYSGHMDSQTVRAMPDGTSMTNDVAGPYTYRDSQGRLRSERVAVPPRPGAKPADDSIIADIQDPVAGFRYILDPVNKVAHRLVFQPGPVEAYEKPRASAALQIVTQANTESLPARDIAGVSAVGQKSSNTVQMSTGPFNITMERWTDPRNGIMLLTRQVNPNGEFVSTMRDYKTDEPDAALFRVPEGYRIVDETGPFNIVHPNGNPSIVMASPMVVSFSSANCDAQNCTLVFRNGYSYQAPQVSGAPYWGQQATESVRILPDGTRTPGALPSLLTIYRDSKGRTRTEQSAFRGTDKAPADITVVEIQDIVSGFYLVIDAANHTVHRAPIQPRAVPFVRDLGNTRATGIQVGPDGSSQESEDLGNKTIAGVITDGWKITRSAINTPGVGRPALMNETWTDLQTGVALMSKTMNGGNETVQTFSKYSSAEPDAKLFQIPAEYKVVDEAGSFQIVLPR